MALTVIALALLLTIVLFNIVLGASFTDYNVSGLYNTTFGIDALTGALSIIIGLIAVASIVGIQVLASGISEQSVRTIIIIIGYAGIWGVFSVLAINLILSIELFGVIIYISLTILYTIGVMNKISN